ncbi:MULTISPECIES: hypothetical protein [Streptomyces]|uniref:hypothetical protein n=1 Tax=Streptomyces TaxID=1883 RepID=UPI001C8EAC73|nr:MULTISPECIES: hypothetical protein [Streptomyces]UBI38341.1 hypothetical protein K7I03_19000 [Streptomyces mobaraensis]UKW30925.1 hypothetical protein MCU78_18955 [Streptomyces sp. TYQ1024]
MRSTKRLGKGEGHGRGGAAGRRRTVAAALAVAATCAAVSGLGPAASASDSAAPAPHVKPTQPAKAAPARVTGEARLDFSYVPRDVIRFKVDATSVPFSHPRADPDMKHGLPTDARGTVSWSHWQAADHTTRRAEAAVDCLVTGGDTATFTAIVTKSDIPGEVGKRYGFSARTGGPGKGRFGFHWAVSNVDEVDGVPTAARVGTCMAPAPFVPVKSGGFTVRHAEPAPLPAAKERG